MGLAVRCVRHVGAVAYTILSRTMNPYREFFYVKVDKASGKGKVNEGAYMIFHENTLEKI